MAAPHKALDQLNNLRAEVRSLGATLSRNFSGWRVGIITSDAALAASVRATRASCATAAGATGRAGLALLRKPAIETVEVASLVVALEATVAVDRADSVSELGRGDRRKGAD